MSMDPFELLKHNQYNSITTMINNTLIHDYGIIVQDLGDGDVEVLSVHKQKGAVTRMQCKYLSASSSLYSSSIKPMPGDLVLVLTLQHKEDEYFTAESPVEITRKTGYTIFNCLAVPLGIFKEDASVRSIITDESITLESAIPAIVNASTADINVEEDFTLDASSVKINEGSMGAARKGDAVSVNMSGLDIQALAAALLTTAAFLPSGSPPVPASTPVALNDGSITGGSSSVLIGD